MAKTFSALVLGLASCRSGPSFAGAIARPNHDAWRPENGWERNLFATAANIVVALGFALLLGAAVMLRGARLDWRSGLLGSLGGYAIFFVALSLGALLSFTPYLIGALQPEAHGAAVLAQLARAFIVATAIANAVFWIGLDGLYGYFQNRLATE
ncbi:MAG: CbtA family protein [Gammaproteobacteria bacterium]|nr:CbtA family protein [Gammaproteobacteria bacterium]